MNGSDPITDHPEDDFLVVVAEAIIAGVLVSADPRLKIALYSGPTVMTPLSFRDVLHLTKCATREAHFGRHKQLLATCLRSSKPTHFLLCQELCQEEGVG